MSEPLACPSCASTHSLDERFCPRCGMPLVYAGRTGAEEPITSQQERARKIKPQFAEGDLVRVAGGRNQAEAEFIQGLLLEEGVPSLLRRSRGFDVPDYLAAGPRDVLVPQSGAETAREVLMQSDMLSVNGATRATSPTRVLVGLMGALVLVALIAWIGTDVLT
jgi:hypothetical protein